MKTKRILIFSTAYLPHIGGAEVAIDEITKRIDSFEFELITAKLDPTLKSEEKIGNVLVHRIGIGNRFDKFFLPIIGTMRVFSIMRDRKIDAFWGVMVSFATGIPYIVDILNRKRRIPIVLTLQEGDSEEYIDNKQFGFLGVLWRIIMSPLTIGLKPVKDGNSPNGMIQLSWRLALSRTDVVTAISSYLLKRAHHFGYEGDVKLIPNGVSFEFFSRKLSDSDEELLRSERNISNGERIIINASRLVEKNGVDDTIKALEYLSEDIKLLVMGDGPDKDKLQKLVLSKNLQERVCFFGKYTHEQLVQHLQIADIFVRPSFSEGMGNVFLESMAAGVPIVATEVGGIPDFLIDPKSKMGKVTPTGLFAEVKNPKSISEKIMQLLNDSELSKILSSNAKQLVKERYDWDRVASMQANVFKELLNK